MRHHGWISREMLTFLEHTPLRRFLGGNANFRTQGATLLDARLFALWCLVLVALALLVWHGRRRLVKPEHVRQLWVVLIGLVFAGSALTYSIFSEPDTDVNFRSLAPYISGLPAPVYTDRYTAFDLGYLSAYRALNVRSSGYLTNDRIRPILQRHRGCLLLSESQLDRENQSRLGQDRSSTAFEALRHPPPGWIIVKRVAAIENPLESIVVLCART
jgi:hypothetical protein